MDDARDPVVPHLRFITDSLTERGAFELWHERVSGFYETLKSPAGDEIFRMETLSWHLGELLAVHARYSTREQARPVKKIRADQVDHYRLILQLEGALRVDADGRRVQINPGQLLLTDMSRPERYSIDAGSNIILFLPREMLDAALPSPLNLHGVVLQGAAASMLVAHLRSLVSQVNDVRRSEASPIAHSTLHLVAAAVAPAARTLEARPAIEAALLRQACRYIELHLTDPSLSPQAIAAAFRISRATLYRLFEPLGGVAAFVKERRLRRVHGMLASPGARHHLATLAEAHGYSDASALSRAFRQQFGYSPSEARTHGQSMAVPAASTSEVSASTVLTDWLRSLRG
ncbi:helix-turn-helix domain-containing protein [Cupriavidus sp. 30B13]|uniref:AraC-like ligand-binding domain-containing protein n=1 Tax=Cupriavidus sp. 30B13 TaxID=3384241 RepID=UPI003B9212B7